MKFPALGFIFRYQKSSLQCPLNYFFFFQKNKSVHQVCQCRWHFPLLIYFIKGEFPPILPSIFTLKSFLTGPSLQRPFKSHPERILLSLGAIIACPFSPYLRRTLSLSFSLSLPLSPFGPPPVRSIFTQTARAIIINPPPLLLSAAEILTLTQSPSLITPSSIKHHRRGVLQHSSRNYSPGESSLLPSCLAAIPLLLVALINCDRRSHGISSPGLIARNQARARPHRVIRGDLSARDNRNA